MDRGDKGWVLKPALDAEVVTGVAGRHGGKVYNLQSIPDYLRELQWDGWTVKILDSPVHLRTNLIGGSLLVSRTHGLGSYSMWIHLLFP